MFQSKSMVIVIMIANLQQKYNETPVLKTNHVFTVMPFYFIFVTDRLYLGIYMILLPLCSVICFVNISLYNSYSGWP